jgi:8-oxo-dGTP diphosphatase
VIRRLALLKAAVAITHTESHTTLASIRLGRMTTNNTNATALSTALSTGGVVRVGVGVFVRAPNDPSKVLCGVRKGSHGAGSLALPGGHLEMMESFQDCATREVMEECGLQLEPPTFGYVTNDPMPNEGKHYVTIFMMAQCTLTDPIQVAKNMEPHKCECWEAYSWDELKLLQKQGRLFGPLDRLVLESPDTVRKFLSE